jgi:hypothetical protein
MVPTASSRHEADRCGHRHGHGWSGSCSVVGDEGSSVCSAPPAMHNHTAVPHHAPPTGATKKNWRKRWALG